MKTETLRNISTDDLRSRIKDTTLELDRLKAELRRRVGEFNTILNSDHATPRRRQLTLTPTHREISSTVQQLRHAKNAKAPKADITKLESRLKRLQGRLRSEKKSAAR